MSGRRVSALVQYFDDALSIQHSPPSSVIKKGPLHPDLDTFQQAGGGKRPERRSSKAEPPPLQRGHTVIRAWRKGVRPSEVEKQQYAKEEAPFDAGTQLLRESRTGRFGTGAGGFTKFEFEEY